MRELTWLEMGLVAAITLVLAVATLASGSTYEAGKAAGEAAAWAEQEAYTNLLKKRQTMEMSEFHCLLQAHEDMVEAAIAAHRPAPKLRPTAEPHMVLAEAEEALRMLYLHPERDELWVIQNIHSMRALCASIRIRVGMPRFDY